MARRSAPADLLRWERRFARCVLAGFSIRMTPISIRGSDRPAIVDDDDARLVDGPSWRIGTHGYAVAAISGRDVLMHRLILQAPRGMDCDHINHDLLDNRRCNLRLCSHAENMANRRMGKNNKLGVRCVYLDPRRPSPFRAEVKKGDLKFTKAFIKIEDAAAWVEMKSRELHGEFACLDGLSSRTSNS